MGQLKHLATRAALAKRFSELSEDGPYSANLDLKSIVPTSLTEPAEVVDRLAEVLLQGDLATDTRRDLAAFLAQTEEGRDATAFRDDEEYRGQKVRTLLGLMLALPEYHAC